MSAAVYSLNRRFALGSIKMAQAAQTGHSTALLHKTCALQAVTGLHPTPCKDGGVAFFPAEHGWASGENCIAHGMDLRLFIKPGFEEPLELIAGVRFSDYAKIGYGLKFTSVHGGAVESCLDEATAECAKSKLFPLATTSKIEFKIKRPLVPNTTYRVYCKVVQERVKGLMYEVSGEITDTKTETDVYATCLATMANPSKLGNQPPPEPVS